MSKAFTKEEHDSDQEDQDLANGPKLGVLPHSSKNYITEAGFLKLRAEMTKLLNVDRPDIVQVVSWAASNGDRSENGDYLYGKKKLREIDRRIHFLTKRLEIAEVVSTKSLNTSSKIQFGATVTYQNENEVLKTIQIVGVDEIDPLSGKISWISPLAKEIIGLSTGDTFTFRSPKGEEELEIVNVKYD